jgi:hypothetical protein
MRMTGIRTVSFIAGFEMKDLPGFKNLAGLRGWEAGSERYA